MTNATLTDMHTGFYALISRVQYVNALHATAEAARANHNFNGGAAYQPMIQELFRAANAELMAADTHARALVIPTHLMGELETHLLGDDERLSELLVLAMIGSPIVDAPETEDYPGEADDRL